MKKNMPLFLNVGEHFLYMDLILVEFRQPILFTCLDERNRMYLVTCFRADAQEKDWLITETTPEQIIDLLTNTLTIRNAFPNGDALVYLVKKDRDAVEPVVQKCQANKVPKEFFPTPDMFMDGDEDEFKAELADLRKRVAEQKELAAFNYSPTKLLADFMWLSFNLPKSKELFVLLKDDDFRTIAQRQRRISYEYV